MTRYIGSALYRATPLQDDLLAIACGIALLVLVVIFHN